VARDKTKTRLIQDQLIRSERLAATGQLAASIAHEINSPLQAILVMLSALRERYREDKEFLDNIELLVKIFNSIRATVKNLQDLNRPGKEVKQSTNVNTIVEKTIELLSIHLKKSRVNVNLDLSSRVPNFTASPQQLSQVLMNLVNNAIEAISGESKDGRMGRTYEGGEIYIKTNLRKGNVLIRIADTGPGIPEKDLNRIFDPFYTKKKRMGMGVGLSICHRIIEDHKGTIAAKNVPEGGAIFTITLPVDQ